VIGGDGKRSGPAAPLENRARPTFIL